MNGDDEPTRTEHRIDAIPEDDWPLEERTDQTARFDLDKRELTPDDKLVIGYLTMEEHGMFAVLPADEQERVLQRLRG